jgi:RNA polymerase-interacting CarD/CdnL/TRCF family regulator
MAKRRCNMKQGCFPTIPMGFMPEEEMPDSIVIRQVNKIKMLKYRWPKYAHIFQIKQKFKRINVSYFEDIYDEQMFKQNTHKWAEFLRELSHWAQCLKLVPK